jgi:hypothetical protein
MELPAHTEYAALAASEAECEALGDSSSSEMSDGSTVGGDGGTYAAAFGLAVFARRVGHHVRRKPLCFVRAAATPFLRVFKPQTVLDAIEWPVSHALTDVKDWQDR